MSATPASATSASPSFWHVIPAAPKRELPARDLDRAVRLDVRAVSEPDPVAALPALEARLEPVEVDDRDGRVEQRHRLASRATASTSIRMPGGRPTCTVVRAG